jgi:phage gp29-like protein
VEWEQHNGLWRAPSQSPEIVVLSDEPIVGDQHLWLQFQRIGGNLTPQAVSQILMEADTGYIARFVDLWNESRQKDGHLHSVMQTRELAVKGLEWSLAPPEDASRAEKKAATECESALRDSENFPDLIHHLVGNGTPHGHATSETMWGMKGTFQCPLEFRNILPRRFQYRQVDGKLVFVPDDSLQEIDLVREYPTKFIQYQPVINGDARVREGVGRLLVWLALFRNWDLRDWLQLGEIGWKPWRLGEYKKGADKKDIDALKLASRTLSTTGSAVFPETTKLTVEWPKGVGSTMGKSSHSELFGVVGAEMSKAVLGQTLSTEQGDRGSQSLGTVQERVRGDILAADAIGVASTLTRFLVRAWYSLNKPSRLRPAAFIFHTEDAVDLEHFSTAVKNLTDAGLRIPSAWVRNQGGIPEPKEGEETIGGQAESAKSGATGDNSEDEPAKAA